MNAPRPADEFGTGPQRIGRQLMAARALVRDYGMITAPQRQQVVDAFDAAALEIIEQAAELRRLETAAEAPAAGHAEFAAEVARIRERNIRAAHAAEVARITADRDRWRENAYLLTEQRTQRDQEIGKRRAQHHALQHETELADQLTKTPGRRVTVCNDTGRPEQGRLREPSGGHTYPFSPDYTAADVAPDPATADDEDIPA